MRVLLLFILFGMNTYAERVNYSVNFTKRWGDLSVGLNTYTITGVEYKSNGKTKKLQPYMELNPFFRYKVDKSISIGYYLDGYTTRLDKENYTEHEISVYINL